MQSLRAPFATLVIGIAATLVIVAVSILPFLNPVWVSFAQERAQAAGWTGWTTGELRMVTDGVLADLVLGPPAFDVQLGGQPVLNGRERQHMVDVRTVFAGFFVAAALAAVVLVAAFLLAREREARAVLWRRLSRAGIAILAVTVVGGTLGVLFFDAAFALFHGIFFPPGSWTFDPATERLTQLFPYQFWVESTIAVGIVIVALAALVAVIGRRRAAALDGASWRAPAWEAAR